MDHSTLITQFYTAFQQKDFETMATLYHPEATFKDAAFDLKSGKEAGAMWKMLLTAGKDLRIEFKDVKVEGEKGYAHWEAWYTFSKTGRKVHNVIDAQFEFKDGLIYRHQDHFDFWRWSRQSLGLMGWLLGWSSFLKNKVGTAAMKGLRGFMAKSTNDQ